MITVTDTLDHLEGLYPQGKFSMACWEQYARDCFGAGSSIFRDDMEAELASGSYSYEENYLPVLQGVYGDPRVEPVRRTFSQITQGLHDRVQERFGKELEVDLVLYLGLCNGAGWVTSMNGREAVLLGIEKILELDWTSQRDLQGLVYHELGHLYHIQHGTFQRELPEGPHSFLWQLFSEGVAMCFEQLLIGDWDFFQQDKNGWKSWCQEHFLEILEDFDRDLPRMNRGNQRYFGDWVDYRGHGDVGYYLGACWIRSLLERWTFDEVIHFSLESLCGQYGEYVRKTLGREPSVETFI